MGRKGPIPERWEDYKPVGEPIKGTRFIAFKVPLRPKVFEIATEPAKETWLDYDTLLNHVPNLGLIIDLTFTFKYYQPSVFTDKGVEHFKIMFEGRKLPKPPQLKIFKDRVEDFLRENKDNDKLIGVHCTHGVNRTGFIICHHLITAMNMAPESAIYSFEAARGHPIERSIYTNFLKRIGTGGDIPLESPDRQLDLVNNDRNRNRDHGNDSRKDTRKRFFNRDYDNDDWRAAPRNFNYSTARRYDYNRREERSRTSNPPQQRRSNYYEILSGDSSQYDRRDSDDDKRGSANTNRRQRSESSQQRSSSRGRNRDSYERYASRDESSRNGRNRDSSRNGRNNDIYQTYADKSSRSDNYQRYASKDDSTRNGRNDDNRQAYANMSSRSDHHQRYASNDDSSRNGRNDDNYQAYADKSSRSDNHQRYASNDDSSRIGRNNDNHQTYADKSSRSNNYQIYASRDESSHNERNDDNHQAYASADGFSHTDNYRRYAPKDESSRGERNQELSRNRNIQRRDPKDEFAYRSQDHVDDTRRRFEMLPEFARRRGETIPTRPIRLEKRAARYSPTV